ncbi:MAG: MutH/Sau3AI family endonuclease [Rhodobacteraceae bacterium]|nr:MutH/Sau3AI family endonuclease [Paracoccaceae bacterium]
MPLKLDKDGQLTVKETMAITMIDPWEVKQKCFRESHLFSKISKLIVVSRLVKDGDDESIVLDCTQFLLANSGLMASIMRDYDEIRDSLLGGKPLSGKMGKYIQPRTKGSGHGSVSRAFYARKEFVGRAIDLESINRQILIDSTGRVTVRGKQHPVGTSGHFPMDCHDRTNPNSDCRLHAGKDNAPNRFELDALMRGLPNNQSGAGRHKCVYCAYKAGYRLGLKRG